MLTVNTKAYGTIEVDERQKITFSNGLFGFENLHEFVLLDAQQQPFYWLQSLEVKETAFVMINPGVFRTDYYPDIISADMVDLQLDNLKDPSALIFAIVTIPENQQKMSANLQGPVIINKEKKIGKQSITIDSCWKTKHYILEELAGSRGKAC